LLYALFDVREGKVRFRQMAPPEGEWLPVRVSADRAVLEGTRWSEALGRASETIRSCQSRFARTQRNPRGPVRLSPSQWRVFVATETIGSLPLIAARSVLSEVDVIESLQALMEVGLVRRVDSGSAALAAAMSKTHRGVRPIASHVRRSAIGTFRPRRMVLVRSGDGTL